MLLMLMLIVCVCVSVKAIFFVSAIQIEALYLFIPRLFIVAKRMLFF